MMIFFQQLSAQIIPFYVDVIKASDFSPKSSIIDTGVRAVVLVEKGETVLDANPQVGFFTKFHYFKRVLILTKSGYDQAAGSVYYDPEMDGKKLKSFRALTYNLVNGEIVRTGIPENNLFIEDPKKEMLKLKFAYPQASVGSILEIEYTVSRNSDLKDWYFQHDIPVLLSSYSVSIPNNWNFAVTLQNKRYLTSQKRDSIVKNIYSWKYEYEDITVHTVNWIFENIPAMKEEPYTSTINNYIGCVKFQLSVRPLQPGQSEKVINDWQWVSNRYLKSPIFGMTIDDPNPWIVKLGKTIVQPDDPDLEKAHKIYAFIRDHMQVNSRDYLSNNSFTLESIYKSGSGNVAEINIILASLLKSQKLNAEGVILATRDAGLTDTTYPIMDNFNYAICKLQIGTQIFFLDASDKTMGFGKLPTYCYNGQARIINKKPSAVYFYPDSIRESSMTNVYIENIASQNAMTVDWTERPGYYESADIRGFLSKAANNQVTYIKSYKEDRKTELSLDSFKIDGLKDLEHSVEITYKMQLKPSGDLFYFNPMLNAGIKTNPLISAERDYPVELPYVFDDSYVLNMEIPEGYEVEELPKSGRIKLNEHDGSFEYLIQKSGNTILFKNVLNIRRATFDPEDYPSLRDFYAYIIKKQADVIVFRKIKK